MNPQPRKTLRDILVSILIGVSITLITELSAALIQWLQGVDAEAVGGVGGSITYMLRRWREWV